MNELNIKIIEDADEIKIIKFSNEVELYFNESVIRYKLEVSRYEVCLNVIYDGAVWIGNMPINPIKDKVIDFFEYAANYKFENGQDKIKQNQDQAKKFFNNVQQKSAETSALNVIALHTQTKKEADKPQTARFEVGKTYTTRSIGDHECVFSYKVVKRTKKCVWIENTKNKKPLTKKRVCTIYDNSEMIYPNGRYSMAAILRASK